ncbi:stealth family protein [Streptomyces sp. NPDC051976]|uniref:stealth family protein n=1 Tax=Streptomyces sp. NPDC051976 TaxID=3154947 RepID=UPI00343DE68D
MRNPEAPRLVGAYRRALPEGARRIIAGHVHRGLRTQVKMRIAGAADAAELARASRLGKRLNGIVDQPGRTVLAAGREPKIALIDADATPLTARRANLAAVLSALAAGGLEHFCVRSRSETAAAVAVRDKDRPQVLAALEALCGQEPGYVTVVKGNRPVPEASWPGFEPSTWRRVARAEILRLTWYRTNGTSRLGLGTRYGCDVEFWTEEEGRLVAPRPGRFAEHIPADSKPVTVSEAYLTDLAPLDEHSPARVEVPTREHFAIHPVDKIRFPVDVVYTWVDGTDPAWLARRAEHTGASYHGESANAARYLSRDELRYSLRSLHMYAPWTRNVYVVTDDQVPDWLDTSVPGVHVVSHREIFRSPGSLPTFNSHAIESQLHRIEGLSEHFLYFNDDVMLGRETTAQDFFLANGTTKFFPSSALVPLGEKSPDDPPVAAAGKNNRRIIEEYNGGVIVQKMKHMPHALRRSVLQEIEHTFAAEHRRTESSRFRGMDDISVASSLHHYYAFTTGRAIPAELPYVYIDLSHPWTDTRLGRLLAARDKTVFCVNDTVSTDDDLADQTDLITPFLESYFPVPGPFEKRPARPSVPGGQRGR